MGCFWIFYLNYSIIKKPKHDLRKYDRSILMINQRHCHDLHLADTLIN